MDGRYTAMVARLFRGGWGIPWRVKKSSSSPFGRLDSGRKMTIGALLRRLYLKLAYLTRAPWAHWRFITHFASRNGDSEIAKL